MPAEVVEARISGFTALKFQLFLASLMVQLAVAPWVALAFRDRWKPAKR